MAVTFYLFCKETGHGVMVGQDSMGKPSARSAPNFVISLFCLAHRYKHLEVTAEPEMEANWDTETAPIYYQELIGSEMPERFKDLPWK